MTKKEWSNLLTDSRVTMAIEQLDGTLKVYEGTVLKLNSNRSQALVKWDDDCENWYGRLGIDLLSGEEKKIKR